MVAKTIKNNPLVSIIIPNWNGKHFLKTCLDSIFQQEYKNFEAIVVDCQSKDGSSAFIKQNYPEVRLVELKEDRGPTNALNIGIYNSKGDYILLLNNDVILPPKCLSTLVLELHQDENSVISPVELDWQGRFRRAGMHFSLGTKIFRPFIKNYEIAPFYPLVACCICTKQTLLDTPLNEHLLMYEESEWAWRLRLKNIKIKISFNSAYLHKLEATSRKDSPKQAFLFSRLMISQCFICLRITTLFLLSPFIVLYYLRLWGGYVKRRQWRSFIAGLHGFFDFWINISTFIQDRKRAQKERKISDWEIIKAMIGSTIFANIAKERWTKQKSFFFQA